MHSNTFPICSGPWLFPVFSLSLLNIIKCFKARHKAIVYSWWAGEPKGWETNHKLKGRRRSLEWSENGVLGGKDWAGSCFRSWCPGYYIQPHIGSGMNADHVSSLHVEQESSFWQIQVFVLLWEISKQHCSPAICWKPKGRWFKDNEEKTFFLVSQRNAFKSVLCNSPSPTCPSLQLKHSTSLFFKSNTLFLFNSTGI